MKIVQPQQEECVNVKPAYFKHTFKELTALVIKVLSLKTFLCQNKKISVP